MVRYFFGTNYFKRYITIRTLNKTQSQRARV